MNRVIEHIEYLVRHHDCVTVNRLGGFVVQHVPSYYDDASGLYFPPRKYVVFNPELNHNDGLLASSIARKENVKFEAASRMIAEEVDAMLGQLKTEGSISLGHLGRMEYADGRMDFVPNAGFVAAPQYYGFNPLKVSRIDVETPEEPQEETVKPAVRSRLAGGIRAAAAVAILVACGILFTTPVTVDEQEMAYASLSIPEVKVKPVVKQDVDVRRLFIARPAVEDAVAVVDTAAVRRSRIDVDGCSYYLVVSSLDTQAQAESFVKRHPGFDLAIVRKGEWYRVVAATGMSADEVMGLKKSLELDGTFPDAWPCHK